MNEKTAVMEDIQTHTGWNDSTLFMFALRFIEASGLTTEFEDFLKIAEEEDSRGSVFGDEEDDEEIEVVDTKPEETHGQEEG